MNVQYKESQQEVWLQYCFTAGFLNVLQVWWWKYIHTWTWRTSDGSLATFSNSVLMLFFLSNNSFHPQNPSLFVALKKFWARVWILRKPQVTIPAPSELCRGNAAEQQQYTCLEVFSHLFPALSGGTLSNLHLVECNPVLCVTWHSVRGASPSNPTAASRRCQNWRVMRAETRNALKVFLLKK